MVECQAYPKIDTLFERGEDFKVDTNRLRRPEFTIPRRWFVTEKIDGTNIRVSLELTAADPGDPENWSVRFYGRTASAQIPKFLLAHLQRTFTLPKLLGLCRGKLEEPYYPVVLYGEGYGAKIQKGGGEYRRDGDVSFRLFDVRIGGTWLRRIDVEDVARQLGILPVPRFGENWELGEIVEAVKNGLLSRVAFLEGAEGTEAEGVVVSTDPPLFNSRGQRLTWKLKTKDFSVE